jgi:hypothetical protein
VADRADFGRKLREGARDVFTIPARPGIARISLEAFRDELKANRETRRMTGLATLDAATGGGLSGGSVTTLVGPPGSIKTALGIQLVKDRARDLSGVAYVYACDQGGRQPLTRLADTYGDIVGSDAAFERFCRDCSRLWVVDESADGATLEGFEQLVLERQDHATESPVAVLIDTAQTVVSEEEAEERAVIGKAYESARRIAERLRIPVIVCSHANRSATAARDKQDRNLARSAGLGSAAIEHRSQLLIFMEKVDGSEKTEADCSIEKCTFGRSGQHFRLVLDPSSWRLTEVAASVSGNELLADEIRAQHAQLDDEVFCFLEQRWIAGEGPSKNAFITAFRAARQVQGRVGMRERELTESIARLVAAVRVVLEPGPHGAHVLTRPTPDRVGADSVDLRPAPPTSAAAPPGGGDSSSASSADPRKGGGADGRRSEGQDETPAPPEEPADVSADEMRESR